MTGRNAEMVARLRAMAAAMQGARNGAELMADQLERAGNVATQADVEQAMLDAERAHIEAATYAARVARLESQVRQLRADLDEARHTIHKREEQVRQLVAMLDGAAK